MTLRLKLLAITSFVLSFVTQSPVLGQDSKLSSEVSQKLAIVTSESTSGIAILVVRDGKVVLQAAGGMADIEKKIPVTLDTKFRIGSITKQFVALAVIRLGEQGKLSLQDPLSKYYPNMPNAGEITLENLITHTSGLSCYTAKPLFYQKVSSLAKPNDVIQFFQNDKPDFDPDTQFKYCNSGYFLLGEIIAKVSGKSLADYLSEEFFKPLGMKNSGIFDNAHPPQNAAKGYKPEDSKYSLALDWDMSWAGGAGAMYSTVGDLIIWNEALYNGKVINPESLTKAITPYKSAAGANTVNYGYGLMIGKHRRTPIIHHGGGLDGWTAELAYYPDQKCTIAVLTNASPAPRELNPELIARAMANKILEDVFKNVPPPQVDPNIDPKSFLEYLGKYDYSPAIMEISVKENRIFATITGQEALELLPLGKDQFFWKDVDAEVSFTRDDKGAITAALHSQNGNMFLAPKITEKAALTEPELDAYVGSYQYAPTAIMTISREGKQLYAQLTGQPKFPIFPVNDKTFAWRVVEAKVEFMKNAEGQVTAVRHSQEGVTFEAPRNK